MAQARSLVGNGFTTFAGRSIAVPAAPGFRSIQEIAADLEITHALSTQLCLSEWAQRVVPDPQHDRWCYRVGERLIMPTEGVQALVDVETVDPTDIDYLNVRVGPATADATEDPRLFQGVHASLSEGELYDAVTRWWPVTNEAEWVGKLFVASIAGFVVLTGRITGAEKSRTTQRVAFEVDTDDAEAREHFAGKRIPVFRGGATLMRRARA